MSAQTINLEQNIYHCFGYLHYLLSCVFVYGGGGGRSLYMEGGGEVFCLLFPLFVCLFSEMRYEYVLTQ